jgi:hypothetical protein
LELLIEIVVEIAVAFEFAVAVTTAIEEENESQFPSFFSLGVGGTTTKNKHERKYG